MTRAFVLGGNGFIGQAVAIALRNRGFTVSALIRNQSQADALLRHEVIPVVGTIEDPASYRKAVEEASVIIDTVAVYTGTDPAESNRKLLHLIAELSKKSNEKKRYIYTSGVLVYSESAEEVDETVLPGSKLIPWRVGFEKEVTSNKDVDGVVIRPAFVWGGAGGLLAKLKFSHDGKPTVSGNPDRFIPWVHIADLADSYVRVAEAAASVVTGQVYNVAAEHLIERDVVIATARAAGAKGEVVYKPAGDDFISKIQNITLVVSAKKIRSQLGWQPHVGSLLQNADIWYKSYKAWQSTKSSS